jgi:signal peptidase
MSRRTEYIILGVMIFLIVITGLTNIGPHLGFLISGIGSGSMSPALDIGDLVVAHRVPANELAVGDIIVFRTANNSENYICHRIIEVQTSPVLQFTTQGDNSNVADSSPVRAGDIIGRVGFHMPELGYVAQVLKNIIGLILCLIIPALLLIIILVRYLLYEIKLMRNKT